MAIIGLVSQGMSIITYILGGPVFLFYHLLFEYFNNGQSLGKMILKLKVVSLTGDRPELMDLIMRWMFRLIDVTFSVGTFGAILISSTKKKQRAGDILGNTTVVRVRNDSFVNLSSISKIANDNYQVTYPLVTRYNDKDMILVKDALNRFQIKPSEKNKSIINELTQKITKELKIKSIPTESTEFLRMILNDYIMLTR